MDNNLENLGTRIKVIGIGGGGSNAVNRMVAEGVQGVEFYVANTDVQSLDFSPAVNKLVLGRETTGGRGAGANPEIGLKAAEESEADIVEILKDTDLVFLAAGLGGGTGTGGIPYIAQKAKELGILTIAVVTKPFSFEGGVRRKKAEAGLEELKQNVDSIIVISNDNLLHLVGRKPMAEAFTICDNILRQGVQTISELISIPAFINLDFADVKSIMKDKGTAVIGIGMAEGENCATEAAEKAIASPLLDSSIKGAKSAIINITGGPNCCIQDANDAVDAIRKGTGGELDTIFGLAINENLGDQIIVTIIATGFEETTSNNLAKTEISLDKPSIANVTIMNSEPKKGVVIEEKEDEYDDNIPTFYKMR